MRVATFAVPLVSLLVGAPGAKSATAAPTAPAATCWTLSDEETLEAPGLSVRLFHDSYPEGKQGGLTLIQHGERVAAVGDVRLAPAPEQWAPLPKPGRRIVDKKTLRLEMPLTYEGEGPAYRIAVEPCGAALCVSVDVERPLAQALVGRAGFNLELFPAALFGKSYHLGARSAVFPRQANGPRERDAAGVLQLAALAQGRRLDVAPEDPLRHLTIEALAGGDLLLLDGRDSAQNGWFVVRALIPAGATQGAIRWRILPNAVPGWRRAAVILASQVGYRPEQPKRALIELDPRTVTLGEAALVRLDPQRGARVVLRKPLERRGLFLRYLYGAFDFSSVRDEGAYLVRYGASESAPFRIAQDVYRREVWQPTLETFLPVQMCHMRVSDRYRIWHGVCHMDDALQAAPNQEHFDGYRQGAATETSLAAGAHVPRLDRGGWHDAGDYDLAAGSQAATTHTLVLIRETFGIDTDQTTIDPQAREVVLHTPDGKADILQQIAHGVENLLGGYRVAGHSFVGIIEPTLTQYVHLGDASTMTDNRVFDAQLAPGAVAGERSGRPDDRWVFTTRDTSLEYSVAAALAAASRVLRGFDEALADECLRTALGVWEYEHAHAPANQPNSYVPGEPEAREVEAAVELLLTTRDARFAQQLEAAGDVVDKHIDELGWTVTRALPLLPDVSPLRKRLDAALARHSAEVAKQTAQTPFGVPFRPRVWGVGWTIQTFAVQQYYLHRARPDLFDRNRVLDVLDYVLGRHPGSATSLVSGVGARSLTSAYGANRDDWSYIPGGMVSGVALIRPDLPELKEPFPYLWQQTEYVMPGAATYVFTVLAADRLLNEPAPSSRR